MLECIKNRFAVSTLALGALATLHGLPTQAATITQATNNTDWPVASTWSNSAAPSPGNDYFTNSALIAGEETLRSPFGGGTFGGNSLTIVSGTRLLTKGNNSSTFTIPNLILTSGSAIAHGDAARSHIIQGGLNVTGDAQIRMGGADRTYTINSAITGGSNLTVEGAGLAILNNASSTFSGTFFGTSSVILDFDTSYAASSLNLASGTQLKLNDNANIAFQNVTFGATELGAGTYTFAELNTAYDSFIVNGGSGTLTVIPEPASLALVGLGMLCMLGRRRGAVR